MTNQIIHSVLSAMSPHLDKTQLVQLGDCLVKALHDVVISPPARQLPAAPFDNSQLLTQFVATKRLEGKSEKTLRQYIRANRRFLAAAGRHCTQITTLDLRYYLSLYASTGVTFTTVHNELRYLSAFYAWLADEDYIARNPAAKIKGIRKDTQKKHLLTDEELAKLHSAAASARDQAVIGFLASTGLRVSELSALNRDCVAADGSVTVFASKTNHYRTVYLNTQAFQALQTYLASRADSNPALILSRDGHRLGPCGIERIIHRAAASLPHTITVHSLRRYFATSLHRRGCALTYISRLLGHASTSMTERYYIQLCDKDLRKAWEAAVA